MGLCSGNGSCHQKRERQADQSSRRNHISPPLKFYRSLSHLLSRSVNRDTTPNEGEPKSLLRRLGPRCKPDGKTTCGSPQSWVHPSPHPDLPLPHDQLLRDASAAWPAFIHISSKG